MSKRFFVDHALSRRLERAEGRANVAFVEARKKLLPESAATWMEAGGTYAMFDAPEMPTTQTFGLGMFGALTAADLDQLEAFFFERGAAVNHEISPLADESVWPLIAERRYAPVEFTSLLFMELEASRIPDDSGAVQVRLVDASERDMYGTTAMRGWSSEHPEMEEMLKPMMEMIFHAAGVTSFVAELDGKPIATGALNIQNGVALLAGASTSPEARRLGAQRALLAARLRYALDAGCELATMGALPGSASQRNAERAGFRIAYTRTKWCLRINAVQ
jgi:GNAT superfamily N-acetyltransferase